MSKHSNALFSIGTPEHLNTRILHIDASEGVRSDNLLSGMLALGLPREELDEVLRAAAKGMSLVQLKRPAGMLAAIHAAPLEQELQTGFSKVITRLARAEAAAHGVTIDQVHFHQIGQWDTVEAVLGFCLGLIHFKVDRLTVSSIAVGQRHQDHSGIWQPQIGPATAWLLEGWATHTHPEPGEWTTPTGAAIVTALAQPNGNGS